ncbi:MAG: hypothetical protein ACLR56_03455 [Oscillospiraceae bacterium]
MGFPSWGDRKYNSPLRSGRYSYPQRCKGAEATCRFFEQRVRISGCGSDTVRIEGSGSAHRAYYNTDRIVAATYMAPR